MMKIRPATIVMLLALGVGGCYHQVMESGLAAGPTVLDIGSVNTGVFGLSGATVDVRQHCPGGVAIVATEMSFMNGVLTGITLGLYTPRHVTITCAASSALFPANATIVSVAEYEDEDSVSASLLRAVEDAKESGGPVGLVFNQH